jgi:two-component system, NtrC family, nitrogen regulation sensor histidine kinase GlnL
MNKLSFSTDNKLCITSWCGEIVRFTGKTPLLALGNKYYDVLPLICFKGKDALAQAVKKKETVSIKGHRIHCLFSHINTDVEIYPRNSSNGDVTELDVTLYVSSACSVVHQLNQSQQFINIGKTASTLAHGVRNPLNAIKGAVVYLGEKYSHEEPLVEFTKIMQEEISRLESFITKFLSASIADMGVSAIDINSVLKKIQVFTSLQMHTRNIQADFDLGETMPIMINAFHLEQIILNVINNAIDAMKHGGRLKVRTFNETNSVDQYAVVEISDTGPGMPDRKINGLGPRSGDAGRGFGLLITYEILKYYRGHIQIDSKKDTGTTVRLYIPCSGAKETQP